VGAAALAEETFLVREPGSGTRLLMERLFADARVEPRIGMEMGSNETIKQAVIAGLGIAFISAHTVAVELADGRLVALDVAGLPVMRTWYIVNLAKKRLLPSAAALRQFMIDEGHAFLPPFPALAAAPAHARPARTKRKSRARAETGRRRLKMSARYPKIEILDFEAGARAARGVAVVIDVFRAFSVACYAFANGAERIIPVADIEDARRLKIENPGFITLGERHARKLEGFDFGNSPTHIEHVDFRGRTLVHTTHAGTQGLVNATHCEVVITGSLVNAAAICRYIAHLAPREVSLVRMGQDARERCAEDDLCAEMLAMRLRGEHFDTDTIRARLRAAPSAQKFFDPEATWAPERDFELCTDADRFDFVLRLRPAAVGPAQLQALAT